MESVLELTFNVCKKGGRTMEQWEKDLLEEADRIEQKDYGDKNVNFVYPVEGRNKFRIIPHPEENRIKFHMAKKHWLENAEGKKRLLICSLPAEGKCPICEEAYALKDMDDDNWWKKRAKTVYTCYVLDENDKPGILEMDTYCYDALIAKYKFFLTSEDEENRNIFSLDEGSFCIVNMTITMQGNAKIRDYDVNVISKISAYNPKDIVKKFSDIPLLDQLNKVYTAKQLSQALDGDFSFMDSKKKDDKEKASKEKVETKTKKKSSKKEESANDDDFDDLESELSD